MFSWNMKKRKVLLWKKVKNRIQFIYISYNVWVVFIMTVWHNNMTVGHRPYLWQQFECKKKLNLLFQKQAEGWENSHQLHVLWRSREIPPAWESCSQHCHTDWTPALHLRCPSHWISFHNLLRTDFRSIIIRIYFEDYNGIPLFSII